MNNEEDRNRLAAFLQDQKYEISTLVYNQPYMLEPTPEEKQINADLPRLKD